MGKAATVWLDTDPSIGSPVREVDDGYALLLAMRSPELRIAGISTSYGNAPLSTTTKIARDLVARFGNSAAIYPLPAIFSGAVSRRDLFRRTPATDGLAAALRGGGTITYIALGPLTNLATFCKLRPELATRIERVIFVGGQFEDAPLSFGSSGSFRIHDANVFKDADAVAAVLQAKIPLLLVPIETAAGLMLDSSDLQRLEASGAAGTYLASKSKIWLWFWTRVVGEKGGPIFDALGVAAVLRSELLVTEARIASLRSNRLLVPAGNSANPMKGVQVCTGFLTRTREFVLQRLGATNLNDKARRGRDGFRRADVWREN